MNANDHKSRRSRVASARVRGIVFSPQGWQRFQAAKQQAESEETWGKRFTQEDLSDRTGLSLNTLARIFKREQGVDRQSLELLFQSFGLELNQKDYTSPVSGERSDNCRTNPQQDWDNAVDASIFYGREAELAQLWQWVVTERCRMVGILGIGGIGKSTLTVKAALQMQTEFEIVVWRSLANAPSLDELLTSLLKFLMPLQSEDPIIPATLDEKLILLMQYLRWSKTSPGGASRRCLLILDNAETILHSEQAGQWRSGYEAYGEFLRILGETPHQSCLLLTSREKPREMAMMEGEQSIVKSLPLSGLTADDGRAIFRQKGVFTGSATEWQILINHYGGNPLALKIVAAATQDVFNGSITEFLAHISQGIFIFEDIRDLLARQFNRLSVEEQKILYWFAIHREPLAIAQFRENVVGSAEQQSVPQQINSLIRRSLLEKIDGLFFLQPVVMEYVTERLIQQVCTEFATRQLDVLQSHSLIRVQAKDYIREVQLRLIMQPVMAWLLSSYRNVSEVEDRVRLLLAQQRQQSGYAAGNLINLLVQLKVDLRGSDFSDLVVQQVDLRQVNLTGVNFQKANLTTSIFSETFGNPISIDISPDGKFVAVGDSNGLVYLWQMETTQLLTTFAGHAGWVWSVAFSPDGTTLASSSGDASIRIWDVKSGTCLQVLTGHTGCVWSVRFSPNGQRLASGSDDQTVRVWDAQGQCLQVLEGHEGNVYSVHFSPDNQTLASGSKDTSIRIWNVSNGNCLAVFHEHTDSVRCVRYSPDGQMLASSSHDRSIRLWSKLPSVTASGSRLNIKQPESKVLHGHTNWVWSLAFSPKGDILASGSDDGTLRLWSVREEQCLNVLNNQGNDIFAIAIADQFLVSISRDQAVRLWDLYGSHLKTLRGYTSGIRSLSLSPISVTTPAGEVQIIASGSQDETIHLWQIQLENPLSLTHPIKSFYQATTWLSSVSFHPDGQTLATNGQDSSSIVLWNVQTGISHQWNSGHSEFVKTVLFSPGGEILASGSYDRTVRLWDGQTHQCLHILRGHESGIWAIAFDARGKRLASGSFDHTIRLWDVQSGECLQVLRGHTGGIYTLAFHPSGERLASGSFDSTIRLWDVQSGECLQVLRGHTGGVWSLAISPDGETLASGGDRTIRLWNLNTGECLQMLHGHTRWISTLIFMFSKSTVSQENTRLPSNLDHILISGSHDQTIKLWDTQMGVCLSTQMADRLYEGMNIQGAMGLTNAQKATLKALGAITSGTP